MNILEKFLFKKGIEKPEDLSPEERKTFDQWQLILNKDELTIKDIKKFCQLQIDAVENKWKDLEVPLVKKAELITFHTIYKTLLMAIDAPKAARENLEIQLNQMLNQ